MNSFKRSIYKIGFKEDNLVPCDSNIQASGNVGVYEVEINIGTDLGYMGIQYNAFNVPDRFQIIYNGQVVADSKFVGNENYFDQLEGEFNVNRFIYEDGEFIDTEEVETINLDSSDLADGSPSENTSGIGLIYFNRTNRDSNIVTIRVTGVLESTVWNIESICPQEDKPTITNNTPFVYRDSLNNVTCETYKVTPKRTFYHKENTLEEGITLYEEDQLIRKANKGYYLYSSSIYYFDGNTITDILNCDINGL